MVVVGCFLTESCFHRVLWQKTGEVERWEVGKEGTECYLDLKKNKGKKQSKLSFHGYIKYTSFYAISKY